MEELLKCVDRLSKGDTKESPENFFKFLREVQIETKQDTVCLEECILPKTQKLFDYGILNKDIFYLVLLASQQKEFLERALNFDQLHHRLCLMDESSLFNHCIYQQPHWFYELLSEENYPEIQLIRLIELTNLKDFNVSSYVKVRSKVDISGGFWKSYVEKLDSIVELYKFYQRFGVDNLQTFMYNSIKYNYLTILHRQIDLAKPKFHEVCCPNEEQQQIYNHFFILSSLHTIITCDTTKIDINSTIQDLKHKIVQAENRLDILEDVFSLIFLKNNAKFCLGEKELQVVLFLLKTVLEEVKFGKSHEKGRLEFLNKIVMDAAWRLELIVNVAVGKYEGNLMHFMISSPESLLNLCLKIDDFNRANQVKSIFLLDDSVVREAFLCEQFQVLRDNLRKLVKIKEICQLNPSLSSPKDTFLSEINKFESNLDEDLLDLVVSLGFNNEASKEIIALRPSIEYTGFKEKLIQLLENRGILLEVFGDSTQNFDVVKQQKTELFHKKLCSLYDEFLQQLSLLEAGSLNQNHASHRILIQINKLCENEAKDNVKYLVKLYNYLKAFSRVLYIEQNTSEIVSKNHNSSFFELLLINRSELMGKLLFERQLDPSEFEKFFGKLKLDYLYHVIGNCFPTINLFTTKNPTLEELYPENELYVPNKNVITYIQKRNWLLALILNEMYKVEGTKIEVNEIRIHTFTNYLHSDKINKLKHLFNNNKIVAALQNELNSTTKMVEFIRKQTDSERMLASQLSTGSNDSLETGEEIMEDCLRSSNWRFFYELIRSLPESQIKRSRELTKLNDRILVKLVRESLEYDDYVLVQFIVDDEVRVKTILENVTKWNEDFSLQAICSEISRESLGAEVEKLVKMKEVVEFCAELGKLIQIASWAKTYETCQENPNTVFNKLLQTDKVAVLNKFVALFEVNEAILNTLEENFILKIITTCSRSELRTLLEFLPAKITLCTNLLKLLKKLTQIEFIIEYLLEQIQDESLETKRVGVKMLSLLNQEEQNVLVDLIGDPLSIIEVLLMNMKLEKLAVILDVIQPELKNGLIEQDKIDELLRNYSEKSLDFRVITQPDPRLLRTPECKLMQSLDSLNLTGDGRHFIMPEKVPSKMDWVQNHEVLECMCCLKTIFSMFNRRHHCRRCGRVVCYACSPKKMMVDGYENLLVRVCNSCFEQTFGEVEPESTSSTKSSDFWTLSTDWEHNEIVRDEFSYEHAPSVSLCLSIMKFHTKNTDYLRFLLDQCEGMLRLLQPTQEPIQEIDYLLVIKMLKSLTIASKMSSLECSSSYGTSRADKILSQAELLGLLAERGCLSLLPIAGHSSNKDIDASVLRILRNKLLEREQWNLALEVSTKAGLENTGVFAAWGKSCLKAGSLSLAREKFQRCLDKTAHYESISEYDDSFDTRRCTTRLSTFSTDSKPSKNPPLLDEIIYILESKTVLLDEDLHHEIESKKFCSSSMLSLNQSFTLATQPEAPVNILNKLRNLNNIVNGTYKLSGKLKRKIYSYRPTIDPMFYEEAIYYLGRYGSHLSLLEFYVKHGEMEKSLKYIQDYQLSCDVFVELYMRCLKDGLVNVFHEHMSLMDSTLDIWKDYLRQICRHLEKQNMLNSLYQLQQFMGDYVRAAMTCVRFYQENTSNFTDLINKVSFLHQAEEHFRQVLEQDQWVEVSSVGQPSLDDFEEKTLTNPSLVMKMSNKLIDGHISTIIRQEEVANFLGECEANNLNPMGLFNSILPKPQESIKVPTLFGSNLEKNLLAVLILIAGKSVEDGFKIALKIIKEFKLKPVKVYCEAGKQLAKNEQYDLIAQLVNCIKESGTNDEIVTEMCDEMLTLAVTTFGKANVSGTKVEDLIKLISDKGLRISAYIQAKQLKTAYFLAVKYKRICDLRRILREAELLNQPAIKALCLKVLQSYPHSS